MNNITIKIPAAEVQKIVQDYINKSLAPTVRAQATAIAVTYVSTDPNCPNAEIMATVNFVTVG